MAKGNAAAPMILLSVDTSDIDVDTWTALEDAYGGDIFNATCYMIRITNDSDTGVYISFDGNDRHEIVPAGRKIEINFQTNSSPSGHVSAFDKRTIAYAQGAAGNGFVYLSGYTNKEY